MRLRDALREGVDALSGTQTPLLDASLLLAESLGWDRTRLLASLPDDLEESRLEGYRSRLAARATGRPVAYILGRKEFWGRVFAVDGRVLIPRPDTETLVAAALEMGDLIWGEKKRRLTTKAQREEGGHGVEKGKESEIEKTNHEYQNGLLSPPLRGESLSCPSPLRVHECCTGSGCVAISIAAERPEWEVSASDLSEGALEVAAANAAALLDGAASPGGRLSLRRSDLLSSVPGSFDLILANPPYVPSDEAAALLDQGWSEPLMALDGGPDGLDLVRLLVSQAWRALAPGGALLVEGSGEEAAGIADLFRASLFRDVETLRDLAGEARVTSGRKTWNP